MERPVCKICRKDFASKDSLRIHSLRFHKKKQTGKGIEGIKIFPNGGEKTDDEFVNDHLDNNKDMYDEEEWKNLKRKANGPSETYKRPKRDKSPTRLKCRLCSASFLDERELARHVEEQHPSCVHCRRRFSNRKEFENHHHPTCPMCNKVFIFQKDLNDHLLGHPKCPQCGETFMSKSKLEIHAMRDHQRRDRSRSPKPQIDSEDDSEIKRCPICLKKIDRRYLERHIRQHRHDDSESDLGDDQSDGSFSPVEPDASSDASTASVEKHLIPLPDESLSDASTTSARKDLVPLPALDLAELSDASTTSAGQELVPTDLPRPYRRARSYELSDELSDASTASARRDLVPALDLEELSDTASAGQTDLPRPYRRARSYELSDDHSSVKTLDEQFNCPDCHRKFPSQEVLDKHYRDKHIKRRYKHNLPCHFCGKSFPSRKQLDKHIEKNHEGPTASDWRPPKPSKDVYQCEICKDILKTREGYLQHMKNHQRYNCKLCAGQFTSTADRDIHMSMSHPRCMLCDRAFATTDEYLRHKVREHPEDRTYDGPDLPSEEEDYLDSDEETVDGEDRQFHKHIDCVTIDKFLQINDLIKQNNFETLVSDEELLEALQIIFKGAIKGYIPLCSPQRLVLTKSMKKLMYSFATRPSGSLLMRNKKNVKQLFKVLWASVDVVIKSYLKYV